MATASGILHTKEALLKGWTTLDSATHDMSADEIFELLKTPNRSLDRSISRPLLAGAIRKGNSALFIEGVTLAKTKLNIAQQRQLAHETAEGGQDLIEFARKRGDEKSEEAAVEWERSLSAA
ncbi:MAG: hypothetical protein M1286_02270 [Candidatus Marsarchaeota archaeon]|nr:hypothetical protein [Candidatus Marsarchaeota archaeon]